MINGTHEIGEREMNDRNGTMRNDLKNGLVTQRRKTYLNGGQTVFLLANE
jgi:hypothetical protein